MTVDPLSLSCRFAQRLGRPEPSWREALSRVLPFGDNSLPFGDKGKFQADAAAAVPDERLARSALGVVWNQRRQLRVNADCSR